MPSRPVKALLAVEPGVDLDDVRDSLPADEEFNVVGTAGNDQLVIGGASTPPITFAGAAGNDSLHVLAGGSCSV